MAYIGRQLALKVKCVMIDNAPELTKGDAMQFYLNNGILQQSSCVDTP